MASREKKQPEKREDSSLSEIMERFKAHPFLFGGTVVVLVITIIAFVFLPMPGLSTQGRGNGQDLVFGYYNKVPIRYARDNYLAQAYQGISQQYQSQMPASDDPNYNNAMAFIWSQAFQAAVVHQGILDEVKTAGYIVPDPVVDRQVAQMPQFQENGRFSASKYRAMDNASRMSLWRQVQESLEVECYSSDLQNIGTSSKEISFISSMASPRRTFDAAVFPFSSYPDSQVIAYAQENSGLFRQIHLSRITVTSGEREAQQVLDMVKNGNTAFEEAAKTNSQDSYADKGGDMGIQMAFELNNVISDDKTREQVVTLAKGSLSDLVKVTEGWAFFRAEDTARPADTGDASQVTKIRNYIMTYSRGRAEDWLTAQAQAFSAQVKDKGFDDAATAGNITKRNFGPISLNYGNMALFPSVASAGVPELANAGTNEFFWKAAFTTALNTTSTPIVVGDNVLVLYPLEESAADSNETQMIENYYPYYISQGTERSYQSYFMSSSKLDDFSYQTIARLLAPNPNQPKQTNQTNQTQKPAQTNQTNQTKQ